MTAMRPTEPSISVRGEHSESVVAELADLSFRLVADMDTETEARVWLQRSADHIIGLMQTLAPGLPGVMVPTTSKTAHVPHPNPGSSPIASYEVSRLSLVTRVASSSAAKGGSSLMSSASKARKRCTASTAMVVTFSDIDKLEAFTTQIVADSQSLVHQLDGITWRVTPHTARRVRRAARTGAVTEAYERAWDLAHASLSTAGTVAPDTPLGAPAPVAPAFTLKPLEISDTTPPTAPSLSSRTTLRVTCKGPYADELAVERDAFDPPELVVTGQVNAKYSIVTKSPT